MSFPRVFDFDYKLIYIWNENRLFGIFHFSSMNERRARAWFLNYEFLSRWNTFYDVCYVYCKLLAELENK